MLGQITASGAVLLDVAGRGDVVGGDRVAQQRQDAGIVDVGDARRIAGDGLEEGRILDVGGVGVPDIGLGIRHLDRLPLLVTVEHGAVLLVEHGGVELLHGVGHFLLGGPDVFQIDRLTVIAGAQRLLGQIDLDAAGERIGHHQRRRGQPVGLDQRMHPAFEVAVAGEHRSHGEVGVLDRLLDGVEQRAGVADAGGAAIADQIEAKVVEIGRETGGIVVVGHHLGAGGERRLHPRLAHQALLGRLLGQQAGGHHDAGVGGVGAGGDGSDHHGAVLQLEGLAVELHFDATASLGCLGFFRRQGGEVTKGLGDLAEQYAILGSLGTGQAGLDFAHVQFQHVGECRLIAGITPEALGLGVGLHQLHGFLGTAGQAQVIQGDLVNREEAAGGAVFRGHVADGGAVGQGQGGQAITKEFDELAHHALLAQHLGHGQHQVGGGDALTQLAGKLEAHHLGNQHGDRLAKHGRLGLDTADAPAQHAQAIDHGGVGVGADQGVGEGIGAAVLVLGPDGAAQVFQVDLVADTGARRDHAEVVEGVLAPAQEGIALAITLHLDLDVLVVGVFIGVTIHHHGVVDYQVDGGKRIDPLRIATGLGHGFAHGGQVDHCRYAGEVLHQHPRRPVLDLAIGGTGLGPVGQGLEVFAGNGLVVFPAQQVLQQHLERLGQLVESAQGLGRVGQAVIVVGALAYLQGLEAF